MVFYILISIVFIAELIITCSIISYLLKWDKIIVETNNFVNEAQPKIKDICETGRKISEQLTELAPFFVENVKNFFIKLAIDNFKSMMTGFGIWAIRQYLKRH